MNAIASALVRLRETADSAMSPWPDVTWMTRSGDRVTLSNGEFLNLPLPSNETVELRSRLVVPKSLGTVDVRGEPLQVIIDSLYPIEVELDGRPVFDDPSPRVAPGPALVTVSRALRTGDNGELCVRLRIPPRQTWLNWLFVHFSTPRLRRRTELLDLAWSRIALAHEVAATDEDCRLVERAAELVADGIERLDESRLSILDQALGELLSPLAPAIRSLRVHVVGHTHIDLSWLWTWDDTVDVIKRDFAGILALMDEFPELTMTHSQSATYELLQRQSPHLFSRVQQRIAEGRWEVSAMQWVESDLNMPSGEAQARQLLHGVRYARRELGVSPSVFLAPDSFGHCGNLPQLAVSAGATSYFHTRCNPGGHHPWPAYEWVGDDGTRLVSCSSPRYEGAVSAGRIAEAAIAAHRSGLSSAILFHGVGNHGGGPTREGMLLLRKLESIDGLPAASPSTVGAYAESVRRSDIPEHHGELNTIFEGCYTSHVDAKSQNRAGESLLADADTLAALAGLDERERLGSAWRVLLFNQFHDILAGSAIREVYEQSTTEMQLAQTTGRAVCEVALSRLEGGLQAGAIAVTNTLGWHRRDVVIVPKLNPAGPVAIRAADGSITAAQVTTEGLAFVASVPAFATVAYQVVEAEPESPWPSVEIGPIAIDIETSHYMTRLHRGSGALVSFVDRGTNRELVSFGQRRPTDYIESARLDLALNVLQVMTELPHGWSAWHLDGVAAERSLVDGGTAEVVERGPVRVVVRIEQKFGSSRIQRWVCFYESLPRIDVVCQIDWQEVGSSEFGLVDLKVACTMRLLEARAWFETPFSAARRPTDGQEVPALRWADVSDSEYGLSVLNDGRHGYDALGGRLRLTLARSSYEPDSLGDLGSHTVRYSLVPHAGDWRTAAIPAEAAGFNQPLIGRTVGASTTNARIPALPVITGSPTVLVAGLKVAEDGNGLVARLYESAGLSGEATLRGLDLGRVQVWDASIVEDPILELSPDRSGSAQLSFRPWQVRTLVLRGPGLAVPQRPPTLGAVREPGPSVEEHLPDASVTRLVGACRERVQPGQTAVEDRREERPVAGDVGIAAVAPGQADGRRTRSVLPFR